MHQLGTFYRVTRTRVITKEDEDLGRLAGESKITLGSSCRIVRVMTVTEPSTHSHTRDRCAQCGLCRQHPVLSGVVAKSAKDTSPMYEETLRASFDR